ncbi:acyltransferase family protein [Roseovarius sp. EL26]|uniref:acyltransferase family protein n=1 Tax=Roseovarius sp. EL26 TaxID=2126672 RepID=UPI000EA1EACF|nr:acyltransferase family protein [Roseovarius sp. EL26]
MTYRPDIDGLRALAILLVTIFHFDLLGVGKAGFIGVDVFFVISGFLITSIIVSDHAAGRFSLGSFYYRRVRRLYPALLATLTLYLLVGFFLFLPGAFQELGKESLLSQLYVVNFYFWRSVNYFGLQAGTVPLLHSWSLAVEEQFYLIYPLFVMLILRWRSSALLGFVLLATVGSFALGYIVTPMKPWASFYLLPTRAWELLAGGVLALYLIRSQPQEQILKVCGPLGLALIFLGLYLHTPATGIPGWFALFPVGGALCLLISGLSPTAPLTRLFSTRFLVWVGVISYPLYLVHWPVMIVLKESLSSFSYGWRLFGFAASFLLAWLIYRLVERPIRSGRALVNPRAYLQAIVGSSVVLIAVSAAILLQQGMPQRFDPSVTEVLAYSKDGIKKFRKCENRLSRNVAPSDRSCQLGGPEVEPSFLIYGDSHANAFSQAMDLWLKRTGQSAVFAFSSGCLPVANLGSERCMQQANQALQFATENPDIKTVMMVSIWRQPYEGGMLHLGRWSAPGQIETAFEQELLQTINGFQAAGKQVVLIDPFFAAKGHVPQTLAKNIAFDRDWPTDKPLSQHREEFSYLFKAFEAAQAIDAKRLSLIEDLCADGTCRASIDGRPVFSDSNHVTGSMSEELSKVFEREWSGLE